MKPIKFKESNVTFAENQPEYIPLPAFKDLDGEVVSCWQLDILERIKVLLFGKIWLHQLTFNKPLQPILLSAKKLIKILEDEKTR
jgi:hypothetical protein